MAWADAGEIKHSFRDGPQIGTPRGATMPSLGSYSRSICSSIIGFIAASLGHEVLKLLVFFFPLCLRPQT
jgi:hypothetical protein